MTSNAKNTVLIVVENINDVQRELIHAAVKEYSNSWWHEFLNVWVVRGADSPMEWAGRLKVLFGLGASELLVLQLPTYGPNLWASIMSEGKSEWLRANLQEPKSLAERGDVETSEDYEDSPY